jgi:hypothetical protein
MVSTVMNKKILGEYYKNGDYVDLIINEGSDNDEFSGFIVGLSDHFVVLQTVIEWHNDGIQIFLLNKIQKCIHTLRHKNQQKILKWNNVIPVGNYSWLDLENYENLFNSIMKNHNSITMFGEGFVEVGVILDISRSKIKLQIVDSIGDWVDDSIEYIYQDIFKICVNDEYSNVLINFAQNEINKI